MVSPNDLDGPLLAALGVALLLGLRHAADPDHLVAVSMLVAGAKERRARTAARLGAVWGAGHALTLLLFGLPVVVAGAELPEPLQRAAELAIGLLIVYLAVRLLQRWRAGAFHVHEHDHEGLPHVHVHAHADSGQHGHDHPAARSPRASFLVGCLHGMGGSAAVGVLLISSMESREAAVAALAVLAGGTAVSMAVLSASFGMLLGAGGRSRRVPGRLIPALGGSSALFGAWYALAAWSLVPYPL
jgi:ABC-type nickel/cobalt efflux system permease component RcnA